MPGCCGIPSGRGGFRLSLRGYHPVADYPELTRDVLGRRTNRLAPESSLIYLKAALFLLIGALTTTLLLLQLPTLRTAALLALAIWSFSRLYYFCFYVIEKYIDPTFKFAGLTSVANYIIARRGNVHPSDCPKG